MRIVIFLTAIASLSPSHALRHSTHQLRDLYAFPKYEIDFLNDLPLSLTDAERARSQGVQAEDEFLHKTLRVRHERLGEESTQDLELIPMKIADPSSPSLLHDYLCLLPSSNTTAAQSHYAQIELEEEHEEVDPAVGWAALSHLKGKCLYLKQGWFTYSYCHDSHIRQFREGRHQHPHPPGGYTPAEDTTFDAYTLGQTSAAVHSSRAGAGSGSSPGRATAIDRLNHEHALSYGLQPSARYLVQRWSDGTRCDKTGRPREVEVQIHCSMTSNDIIYMIKEMAICSYVMIIHTPHLCSLPGFKVEHTEIKPAPIRCREVISDEDFERWSTESHGDAFQLPPKRIEPAVDFRSDEGKAVEHEGLKAALEEAIVDIQPEEEMVVLSWEEGEDGPVMIEAEGEGINDKELLFKLLKEYFAQKGKKEGKEAEDERRHDEL